MQRKSFGPYRAEWSYPNGEDEENEKDVIVQFFKDDKPTYSLVKNNYRTSYDNFMLLEWFPLPNDSSKTVHIFNLEHSAIAVVDADTGEVLRTSYTFDMFISSYELLDNGEYLYLSGWVWSPVPSREIFHIPTLLTKDRVEGIPIPAFDSDRIDPGVDLFGFSTCSEFLANKEKYFSERRAKEAAEKFNKNGKECFLWAVLHPKTEDLAKIVLDETLRTHIISLFENELSALYIQSIGNISGSDLHKDWALYDISDSGRWEKRDELAYYVLQIVGAPGFIKPISIDTVDFRYEIKAVFFDDTVLQFTMHISQKYKPSGSTGHYGLEFEPSSDSPLQITFD